MAGDPSTIPDGYVRSLSNMLLRPGPRFDSRPPAVYDSLMSVIGLARWEDLKNQVTRFLAFDSSKLYQKATSGETWDGGTSGLTVTRLTSYENYRGKLYMMFDDGAGNPSVAAVWDGTNLSISPFDSPIVSRVVVTAGDRLFFFYPRVTVTPQFQNGGDAYDLTAATRWTVSGATATNLTASGGTVCRLYLTSTTAAQFYYVRTGIPAPGLGIVALAASAGPQPVTWRASLRCLHASYQMPVTLEIYITTIWTNNGGLGTTYAKGDLISDSAGHAQRCTTGGVGGAGAAPAFSATVGGTVADGAAVWTCEGSDVVGSVESYLSPGSESSDPDSFYVVGVCPAHTNTVNLSPRCKFFNTSTPMITLAPVDVSFKDGITDGDPRKKNWGQQVTLGSYYAPFFNLESSASATINLESVIHSETSSVPPLIRAANFYEPKEAAGLPTAGYFTNKRLVMWKRRAFWVFALQRDPDNPIIEESIRVGVGCISPAAVAAIDDETFWIGENECYRMKIGADAEPTPFCGDAMREEIMAKGANWVELQATYNLARLSIDQKNREVWVYTQKGKLYVFNLATGAWSTCDIQGKEVAAMAYNPATTKIGISLGGFGLIRLDDVASSYETIDNTGTLYGCTKEITLRPFELFHPRAELCLHELGLYHLATESQVTTPQFLYVYVSTDRGATFPKYDEVLFDVTTPRVPISLYQFGVSVMVKIAHDGKAGKAAWSLSKGEAMIELLAGEWPWSQPTQVGSSL